MSRPSIGGATTIAIAIATAGASATADAVEVRTGHVHTGGAMDLTGVITTAARDHTGIARIGDIGCDEKY